MGFKVIFAPQAIERLEEIVRYIAKDNPTAAEKFGLRLVERTALLADFLRLGNLYQTKKSSPVGLQAVLDLLSPPA